MGIWKTSQENEEMQEALRKQVIHIPDESDIHVQDKYGHPEKRPDIES